MTRYIPTIIIDPSALFREGLARILSETRFRVTISCSFLEELPSKPQINGHEVLLLIGLGENPHPILSEVSLFKAQHHGGRIIVLAERGNMDELFAAAEAGVDAYLTKQITSDALIKSLDLVLMGETIFPGSFLRVIRERDRQEITAQLPSVPQYSAEPVWDHPIPGYISMEPIQRLSGKEQLILRCLTQGASNKMIARELNMAEATVKVHIKGILRKIRVKNRTQAAIWALNSGLPAELETP